MGLKELIDEGLITLYHKPGKVRYLDIKEVEIWDETLRDGAQTPNVVLTHDEKSEIASALANIGVKYIVLGFPAVSRSEKKSVEEICSNSSYRDVKFGAPARARIEDIDVSIDCGVDFVPIFISTCYYRIMADYLKKEPKKTLVPEAEKFVLKKVDDSISYASERGAEPVFVAEDASRSNFRFLTKSFRRALKSGSKKVIFADTVGYLSPSVTNNLIYNLRNNLGKKVDIGVHLHNDFGNATANTTAAVLAGAKFPHVCVNGYGERAGNAPLEEVVVNLEFLHNVDTGIEMEKLQSLSHLVEKAFCIPVAHHKPVVGRNAFSHESGIHAKAVLIDNRLYESLSAESLGRETELILGSGSGVNVLKWKLDNLGIQYSPENLFRILRHVKVTAEMKSKQRLRNYYEKVEELEKGTFDGISKEELVEIVKKVEKSD